MSGDLKCHVAKTTPLFDDTHIKSRLDFVSMYGEMDESFWDFVIFADEKPLQNFNDGKTLIRIGKDEADDHQLRVIKDKT